MNKNSRQEKLNQHFKLISPRDTKGVYSRKVIEPMINFDDTTIKLLEENKNHNSVISPKYKITKKDLLNSHNYIGEILSCFPPNIIIVNYKTVWFYRGLEEGLNSWDTIDKRKLKKLIRKRKIKNENRI